MIVGFSRHGRGDGCAPVGYVTAGIDDAALAYLIGASRYGRERNPAPVVVRGDPKVTLRLIDSVPFTWRYTSGVLSFAPGEKVTPEVEAKILSIDADAQRIALSMKACIQPPQKENTGKKEEAAPVDEPPRAPIVPKRTGELKGGTKRKGGGEKFGLNW